MNILYKGNKEITLIKEMGKEWGSGAWKKKNIHFVTFYNKSK